MIYNINLYKANEEILARQHDRLFGGTRRLEIHARFLKHLRTLGHKWSSGTLARPHSDGKTFWRRLISKRGTVPKTVIFFHGTGNDHLFGMYTLFERILNEGYHIFTLDLDGHGLHSSTSFSPSSLHDCCIDIVRFVQKTWPEDTLHLLGYSLGGALILQDAQKVQEHIQSIMLLGVPFELSLDQQSILGELKAPLSNNLWNYAKRWGVTRVLPAFGPILRPIYPLRMRHGGSLSYLKAVQQWLQGAHIYSICKQVQNPTLVIVGEHDKVAPSSHWMNMPCPPFETYMIKSNHMVIPFHSAAIDLITTWLNRF